MLGREGESGHLEEGSFLSPTLGGMHSCILPCRPGTEPGLAKDPQREKEDVSLTQELRPGKMECLEIPVHVQG